MATRKTPKKRTSKYGPAAKKSVESTLHRAKRGELKSGAGKHPKVKSRKQAIAIGLSEARKKGAKVPPAPKRTKRKTKASATEKRARSTSGKPGRAKRASS
jgi:hypothetical protein